MQWQTLLRKKLNYLDQKAKLKLYTNIHYHVIIQVMKSTLTFMKTKTTICGTENPTKLLENTLKASQKDIRLGKVSPLFENAQKAINWLNNLSEKHEG